jgi:transcriptional regulator with XRE-family HTH domain
MATELPALLKELRGRAGLSPQEVVDRFRLEQMELTRSAICNWETGTRRPTQQNLWMLATVYGCEDPERLSLMGLLFECPPSRRGIRVGK